MRHRQKSFKSVGFNRYTVKEVHESAISTLFKSLRDSLKGDISNLIIDHYTGFRSFTPMNTLF